MTLSDPEDAHLSNTLGIGSVIDSFLEEQNKGSVAGVPGY